MLVIATALAFWAAHQLFGGASPAAASSGAASQALVQTAPNTLRTLERHFGVFRAHRGPGARVHSQDSPALPTALYNHLESPAVGSPLASVDPDPALATYLGTIGGTYPVWAVPAANGVVCLEVAFELNGPLAGSENSCNEPQADEASGGTVAVGARATEIAANGAPSDIVKMLYGLVPNGTASVTVDGAEGDAAVSAAVSNNFWSVTGVAGKSATLTFSGADGQALGAQTVTIP
jgi:hypothetical protein